MKDLTDPTNRDTVPAMLTPGEFVLNKEASQMYAPYIEQMNNHGLQVREQKNMGGKISPDTIVNGKFNSSHVPTILPPQYNTGGLVNFLKEHEGYRDKAYQDQAGVWTIGYGRTRNPDGSAIKPSQTTNKKKEDSWLSERAASDRSATEAYGKKHGYDWNDNQVDALASFRYNIGNLDQLTDGGTRGMEEITMMLPEYNKAGGQVSKGLQNRRNAELDLFQQAGGGVPQMRGAPPQQEEVRPLQFARAAEQKQQSFGDAFAAARAAQGAGGVFEHGGQQYTTDRADDEFNMGGRIPGYNIGGWLSGLFKPDEERMAELQGVADRQADMEMLNSTNTQAADQYGQQVPPPMNDLPIPNSDESLLQGSSGSVENAKMAQSVAPVNMNPEIPPGFDMAVGSPERMAAIEAGELEPTDADFAYEEQMYNKTQELDLLRKQQAVTASDSPQAIFQQEREQNLTNDINALMQAPTLEGPPPELESGSLDFATAEEGLPEFDPGVIPGMSAPELPEGYEQIVTDTPIAKADSNIRLEVAQRKKDGLAMIQEADAKAVEAENGIRNARSANEIERFQRMADQAKQMKAEGEASSAQAENEQAQITERDGVANENAQAIYDAADNRDDLRAQRTAALESIGVEPNKDDMPDPLAKENIPNTKAKVEEVIAEVGGETLTEAEASTAVAAGNKATPEQKAKAEGTVKEAFGDLFDKKELVRAGVMFAGALLTGMSPQRALAFAGQGYMKRLDAKEATRAKSATALAKAQAKGAPVIDMTKPEAFVVDGKRVNTFTLESTNANGVKTKARVLADGTPIPPDSHQNFDTVPGTSEYNKRVHTEAKTYKDTFKELQERFGESKGKDNQTIYATDLTPSKVGTNTAKWAIKNDVPPEAVGQVLDNAYAAARNDARAGNKPKNIEAYLNSEYIQTKTGSSALFEGAEPLQVNSLISSLTNASGKDSTTVLQFGRGKWNELGPEGQKGYERRSPEGSTGFMTFMQDIISGEI